jgi:Aminotransferase class-V
VAKLIGADPKEIIFTSGATEANNLSLKGVAHFYKSKKKHIITTQIVSANLSFTLTPFYYVLIPIVIGDRNTNVSWNHAECCKKKVSMLPISLFNPTD